MLKLNDLLFAVILKYISVNKKREIKFENKNSNLFFFRLIYTLLLF